MPGKGPLSIAVIGAGAAGIVSSYLLQKKCRVTLFEKNDYIGGHTHTLTVPGGPDAGTPVDTGFIVCNDHTYPNLLKFFNLLNVPLEPTTMSFSYYKTETNFQYGSMGIMGLFGQRRNLSNPHHYYFVYELIRFCKKLKKDLLSGGLKNQTIDAYLKENNFSTHLIERFVIPMGAAIWSASLDIMMKFPVTSFAHFYDNHGLLNLFEHPQWYYVKGGSKSYVEKFLKVFSGVVEKESKVVTVERHGGHVDIVLENGEKRSFDKVVLAAHANEAYAMLKDPSEVETRVLSSWDYSENRTFLHTDNSFMPTEKRIWASWNYMEEKKAGKESPISVTYYMNQLQNLNTEKNYYVTLNPARYIMEEDVIAEMMYTHPQYTFASINSQKELPLLQGRNNTYYCGSYHGYGFHEDAVRSAVDVATKFGIEL